MHAPVNVRGATQKMFRLGVDYDFWLKRGRRVVEIDERLAARQGGQGGEVSTDFFDIKTQASTPSAKASRRSSTAALPKRRITSAAKACVSMRTARSYSRPRLLK